MAHSLGPGGTERQLAAIAKSIDRGLFTPHVAAFHAAGMRADELRAHGIPILELPVRSLTNRTTAQGFGVLRRYVRQHGIGLAHTFDYPLNVFAAPAARLNRVPVVMTSQRCYRDLIPPKYHPLLRFSHWLADGVVANCQAMRAHLEADYGVGSGKIRVCYNGVDTALFHPRERRRTGPFEDASLVIGAISVLRPEKRLDLLVRAFAAVHRSGSGLRLLIMGDGPEREGLERQASALGVGDACRFEPMAVDVALWARSIDIFVQCSNSEALSNALMEAMACGACGVASRVGGNPELIVQGETGLLFASEDAGDLAKQLETLIGDATLRAGLACAGARKMAEVFSLGSASSRMQQIYVELLSARGAVAG